MEEVWPKETAVWKYSKDITEKYINEKRLYWGIDGLAKFPRVNYIFQKWMMLFQDPSGIMAM